MKRELALQLLRHILPESEWDEDRFQQTFSELEILADLKYNRYEMYQPGRLFFENLYAWLSKFEPHDRSSALEFVHQNLIFISREEFQQLAQLLYNDQIRQRQMDQVSDETGIRRFRVRQLAEHTAMKRIQRASLYVGMSDGARIDYFRRQNENISNEQVLPSYEASDEKVKSVINELGNDLGETAKFECLFLLDDFSASGKTLLREVLKESLTNEIDLVIPDRFKSKLQWDTEQSKLEFSYMGGKLDNELKTDLLSISSHESYQLALKKIFERHETRDTELKGSLVRIGKSKLLSSLSTDAKVYFCPLLITEYALDRLKELIPRNPNLQLRNMKILPGAIIPSSVRIVSSPTLTGGRIGELCKKYYSPSLEDEHTGNVMFGYDNCGLPVVLHHNTPNNSIYLLWSRKWSDPLFARYARHGREIK